MKNCKKSRLMATYPKTGRFIGTIGLMRQKPKCLRFQPNWWTLRFKPKTRTELLIICWMLSEAILTVITNGDSSWEPRHTVSALFLEPNRQVFADDFITVSPYLFTGCNCSHWTGLKVLPPLVMQIQTGVLLSLPVASS